MRLPKLLIVHDKKTEANNVSNHLSERLPKEFHSLAICRHYHSDMSPEYLEETFASFADFDGVTLILNGTSAAGTGLDVRGIQGLIQYGICTDVPEMFQRGGRGGRDSDGFAFFLIMIEPWVEGIDIGSLRQPDEANPDQPICLPSSRKVLTKQEHCGRSSILLVMSPECLRQGFAHYFKDKNEDALAFTGRWCCDHHHRNGFSLLSFFLGPIYSGKHDFAPVKRKRNKYRLVSQRKPLEHLLKAWVFETHLHDPLRFAR